MVADYTRVQGALDESFGGRAVAQGCVLAGEEGAVSTEARFVICVLGCHFFTFKIRGLPGGAKEQASTYPGLGG